jgi:hypothetical protein
MNSTQDSNKNIARKKKLLKILIEFFGIADAKKYGKFIDENKSLNEEEIIVKWLETENK